MSRQPSAMGHIILPYAGGWYAPDYMGPEEAVPDLRRVRALVESREAAGDHGTPPESVAWDARIVSAGNSPAVAVGSAASALGAAKGDHVRVTLRRIEDEDGNRRPSGSSSLLPTIASVTLATESSTAASSILWIVEWHPLHRGTRFRGLSVPPRWRGLMWWTSAAWPPHAAHLPRPIARTAPRTPFQ